jgi:hypothetical protein
MLLPSCAVTRDRRIRFIRKSDSYLHMQLLRCPGANPTIASYNANDVKIYNATSSLVRFENKHVTSTLKKNALAYYRTL